MFKVLLCFVLILSSFISPRAFAESDELVENTKSDLFLVAGAGAGGAVLGLSTLSFYDKPSKHISNIWTGAALGIIAGVIYVAFNYAQKSQEVALDKIPSSKDLSSLERTLWHNSQSLSLSQVQVHSSQIWSKSF